MQVREYKESDLAQLKAIHASQGFDYAFPDLSNPLFLTKLVVTDGGESCRQDTGATEPNDKILGAALLRLTAEAYLLLDPFAGTPHDRWQSLLTLHAAT